ncbi:hypothetical protein ACXWQT_09480, partial [Streptococcus pyogenes]
PKLACFGLRTCYGEAGKPRRALTDTAGWDATNWPGGLPEWIVSGFEETDPVWWPFTDDQRVRVRTMAKVWLMQQCKKLAVHLPNSEAVIA